MAVCYYCEAILTSANELHITSSGRQGLDDVAARLMGCGCVCCRARMSVPFPATRSLLLPSHVISRGGMMHR